jgi:negative regulator of replication initiation
MLRPFDHTAAVQLTDQEFEAVAGIAERSGESISDVIRRALGFPSEADAKQAQERRRYPRLVRLRSLGEHDVRLGPRG